LAIRVHPDAAGEDGDMMPSYGKRDGLPLGDEFGTSKDMGRKQIGHDQHAPSADSAFRRQYEVRHSVQNRKIIGTAV